MKLLIIISVFFATPIMWATPPKVSQPSEGAVIGTNRMLLFMYPTPTDVIESRWVKVNIYERDVKKALWSNMYPPVSNYRILLDLEELTNGHYTLEVFYANRFKKVLTPGSKRNFELKVFDESKIQKTNTTQEEVENQ